MTLNIPVLTVSDNCLALAYEKALLALYNQGTRIKTQYDKPGDPLSIDSTMDITIPLFGPHDPQSLSQKYKDLKNQLMQVGLAIPGTIHALYALCGSSECECAKNKSKRHGPYYRWHHLTEKNKVTIGINETDLHQFEMWVKNRESLEKIVKQLLELGVAQAETYILTKKQHAEKLKKDSPAKRGK